MSDNLSLVANVGNRSGLTGLPQRLVQDGVISEEDALTALTAAKEKKSHFVSQLVGVGAAKPRDIAEAAAGEFGVPLLDLDALPLDLEVTRLVSDKLLAKHRVLPMFRRGKRLFLGVSDPTDLHAIDEIKFQTGLSVDAVVVEDDKLQRLVDKAIEGAETSAPLLGDDEAMDLEGLEVSGGDDVETDGRHARRRRRRADRPLTSTSCCWTPSARGASDIHFEPYEKTYRVRYRMDGVLKEVAQPPVQLAGKIAARLKVMSPAGHRRTARAAGRPHQDEAVQDARHRLPRQHLPDAVRRKDRDAYPRPSSAMLGIDALGYEPFQKDLYLKYLAKPQGMILVTGPTGSGKTVSLYTGLNILNKEDTNISTAEDPAEINLPGINQVNVNPKVGLTFAAALRAFLRQDPDVIMVGEIRDLETAEIAIKAAQTGHLVLSTLHTNDAPQTLTRLVNMGVKPYAIATSVTLIIAQRLARRLCTNCKQPIDVPPEALRKEGFDDEQIRKGMQLFGPGRLPELHGRLQGAGGHLPGHAGHRRHRAHHHGRRQRHRYRRCSAPGRASGTCAAPVLPRSQRV